MSGHLPADDLAVLALDDPDLEGQEAAPVRAHLAECADCRAEFDDLAQLGRRGRAAGELVGTGLTAPPAELWARVAAGAGVNTASLVEPAPARPVRETPGLGPLAPAPPTPEQTSGRIPVQTSGAAPPSLRLLPRLALAAAVGVVVGIGATLAGAGLFDDDPDGPSSPVATAPSADSVLARTRLAPLPRQDTSGAAELRTSGRVRHLDVDLSAVDTGNGFVQVWLFDPKTLGMVSVGVLDGDSGSFVIPPGLDLDTYRGVDISLEPYDGNPEHATGSLARGVLRSA
jgi:hypothetical protein